MLLIALFSISAGPCSEKMTGAFAHVELLGHSATDSNGCQADGYSVDGEKVARRQDSAKALKSAGWAKKEQRLALAIRWVKVLDDRVLLDGHEDKLNDDGSVSITGWIQYPPGMRPERVKVKMKMTFAADASFKEESLERVVLPL